MVEAVDEDAMVEVAVLQLVMGVVVVPLEGLEHHAVAVVVL